MFMTIKGLVIKTFKENIPFFSPSDRHEGNETKRRIRFTYSLSKGTVLAGYE